MSRELLFPTKLPGNGYQTSKGKFFFFTQPAVNFWNVLPQEFVEVNGIAMFKKGLEGRSIDNY